MIVIIVIMIIYDYYDYCDYYDYYDYGFILWSISRNDVINRQNNFVLEDKGVS